MTATVDLPTPPLPLATAITRRTSARRSGGGIDWGAARGSAATWAPPRRTRATPGGGWAGRGGQHHLGASNARNRRQGAFGRVPDWRVQGDVGRRRLDHEARPPFADHQRLNQAGRVQTLAGPGVLDGVEQGEDLFAVGRRGKVHRRHIALRT